VFKTFRMHNIIIDLIIIILSSFFSSDYFSHIGILLIIRPGAYLTIISTNAPTIWSMGLSRKENFRTLGLNRSSNKSTRKKYVHPRQMKGEK